MNQILKLTRLTKITPLIAQRLTIVAPATATTVHQQLPQEAPPRQASQQGTTLQEIVPQAGARLEVAPQM